jgi:hypothetical protein
LFQETPTLQPVAVTAPLAPAPVDAAGGLEHAPTATAAAPTMAASFRLNDMFSAPPLDIARV